mmetsp:Transcript_9289/g.11999  ORF Transcript_9289/g.11999 Transcript_9289/m.11999 type:complete len:503 (-) Transcript_9289:274-1782(-)
MSNNAEAIDLTSICSDEEDTKDHRDIHGSNDDVIAENSGMGARSDKQEVVIDSSKSAAAVEYILIDDDGGGDDDDVKEKVSELGVNIHDKLERDGVDGTCNYYDLIDDDDEHDQSETETKGCEGSGKKTSLTEENDGKLQQEKIKSRETRWMEKYDQLKTFKARNNHINVKREENAELYRWIIVQRRLYCEWLSGRKISLTDRRKALLDNIDFDEFGDERFFTMVKKLKLYKQKYGTWHVKKSHDEFLSRWVHNDLRVQYCAHLQGKDSKLTTERMRALTDIKFPWKIFNLSLALNRNLHSLGTQPQVTKRLVTKERVSEAVPSVAINDQVPKILKKSIDTNKKVARPSNNKKESRFVFVKKDLHSTNDQPWHQQRVKKRKMFNFEMSVDEAYLEQEKLFQQARENTKHVKLELGSERSVKNKIISFEKPVDVEMLPSGHWKWDCMYARLGLPEGSPAQLVKKHYRKLALLYHPDKNVGIDIMSRFVGINEAYTKLTTNNIP